MSAGACKRRVSTAKVPTVLDASPRVRSPPLSCDLLSVASDDLLAFLITTLDWKEMPTKDELLTQAKAASDPREAEKLYREILGEQRRSGQRGLRDSAYCAVSPIDEHAPVEEREAELRRQESALVKLGEIYRDQKYALAVMARTCLLTLGLKECEGSC